MTTLPAANYENDASEPLLSTKTCDNHQLIADDDPILTQRGETEKAGFGDEKDGQTMKLENTVDAALVDTSTTDGLGLVPHPKLSPPHQRTCSLDLNRNKVPVGQEFIRERPSTIDLPSMTKENRSRQRSLLSYSVLKKEMRKLSESRGVNLPAIQLNDFQVTIGPNSGGKTKSKKKKKKRAEKNDERGKENVFSSGSSSSSDVSPSSSTTSPIGHTLRHSADYTRQHDFDRTVHSESFRVDLEQAEHAQQQQRELGVTFNEDAIQIRIFYPNGTAVQFLVEKGAEANAADLLALMADHLHIGDVAVAEEALAIWIVSPLLELQLKLHHTPYNIYMKWPAFLRRFTTAEEDEIVLDQPLLVLRRNVLLTVDREIKFVEEYEQLAELLYLHARDEYLSGRYLVDIDMALELVGLQMAIEFGPYTGDLDEALELLYDHLHELAPSPHTKVIKSFHLFGLRMIECKAGLEHRVVEEYRTASQHYHSNDERRKAFLAMLRGTPFYGAAFYSGTIDHSRTRSTTGSSSYQHSDRGSSDVECQNGSTGGSDHHDGSSTKSTKSSLSLGSLISYLRNRLHHNHGTKARHHAQQEDVLIGINHSYITLIDPKKHRMLNVYEDHSPEGNMSLNEKISMFCGAD